MNKQMNDTRIHRILVFLSLHIAILLYSTTGIFTKLASKQPVLSYKFILLYGSAIFLMFVYALLWQQFLKRMPLNTAYANKSMSTIWTMVFGCVVFREKITIGMLVGGVIIIIGVYLVVTADE
ncbi:EamA family transporter [Agathobaculum hominis]